MISFWQEPEPRPRGHDDDPGPKGSRSGLAKGANTSGVGDRMLTETLLTWTARLISGASVSWIESQPDTCQRVYFANHTSHLDALIVWSSLPTPVRRLTRPIAARDYWENGFFKPHLANTFNAMLIDRKKIKVHQSPVDKIIQEMGDEYSVILFPEGGRSLGDEVGEFKSGLYYLSKKKPELELIPVYINNMNRILPRGEVLPVPLLSSITFGPPLWLEAGEAKLDFLARARQSVLDLRDA